jgi:hypothetical protein
MKQKVPSNRSLGKQSLNDISSVTVQVSLAMQTSPALQPLEKPRYDMAAGSKLAIIRGMKSCGGIWGQSSEEE